MSSVVFYSYNMSKNFLLVDSTFAHPNGSSAFRSSTSSNVVSSSNLILSITYELFQLSINLSLISCKYKLLLKLVEDIGVEPMTSCVQGRRSSQLS